MVRLALVSTSVAACSDPPRTVACMQSLDCARNEICRSGLCVARAIGDAALEDAEAGGSPADSGGVDGGGSPDVSLDASTPDAGCPNPIVVSDGLAYCSIGEAIARASPGSIVDVPEGEFVEALSIGTALTLRGRGTGPSGTVLASPGGGAVLSIGAANVTVDSIAIDARGGPGVFIDAQAVLSDTEIRGALGSAIRVSGAGIATLIQVLVPEVSRSATDTAAVLLERGATAMVIGSRIEGSGGDGIRCEGANLVLRSSTVRSSRGYGIHALDADVTVEAGTVVSDGETTGIAVFASTFVMRDSESSRNGPPASSLDDGLWLASPTSAIVERNTFSSNRGYGIYCSTGVDASSCIGNVFSGNNLGATNCMSCD